MSDEEGRPELRPARPDAAGSEERPSYMPRIPWRWVVLGTAALVATFGAYFLRREQRAEAVRQDMLTLHEERLSEVSSRYMAFRDRLENLIHEAAQAEEVETWVDPRLNLAGLRAGEGLYLRLPLEAARVRENVPRAARGMSPDSIMRCLGISAMNVRGLYESGDFLTPEWVEAVRNEQDMMRLRVYEDQLGRHVHVDTPVVVDMMQADWFMLVLQRGENRREHPVDVYLWDLRRDRQLLRARVQSRGLLVPVRIQLDGQGSGSSTGTNPASGGANDCSIASQVRALAGAHSVEFGSGDVLLENIPSGEGPSGGAASEGPPSGEDGAEGSDPAAGVEPASEPVDGATTPEVDAPTTPDVGAPTTPEVDPSGEPTAE